LFKKIKIKNHSYYCNKVSLFFSKTIFIFQNKYNIATFSADRLALSISQKLHGKKVYFQNGNKGKRIKI